jgi:hypothetical protein
MIPSLLTPALSGQPLAAGPGWRELIERCWAEDPEQRPDFSVVEEELRGIAREVKRQQAPAKRSAIPVPRSGSRPNTTVGAAAALRRQSSASRSGTLRRQPSGGAAPAGAVASQAAGAPMRQPSSSSFQLQRQHSDPQPEPETPAKEAMDAGPAPGGDAEAADAAPGAAEAPPEAAAAADEPAGQDGAVAVGG